MCKVLQHRRSHEESTFNNILIEGVNFSICHSLWNYWAMHPQADATDVACKAQTLLANQKEATKSANTDNQATSSKQYGSRTWNKPSVLAIEAGSSTSPTRSFSEQLELFSGPLYTHPIWVSHKIKCPFIVFEETIARCIRLQGLLQSVSLDANLSCTTTSFVINIRRHTCKKQ